MSKHLVIKTTVFTDFHNMLVNLANCGFSRIISHALEQYTIYLYEIKITRKYILYRVQRVKLTGKWNCTSSNTFLQANSHHLTRWSYLVVKFTLCIYVNFLNAFMRHWSFGQWNYEFACEIHCKLSKTTLYVRVKYVVKFVYKQYPLIFIAAL